MKKVIICMFLFFAVSTFAEKTALLLVNNLTNKKEKINIVAVESIFGTAFSNAGVKITDSKLLLGKSEIAAFGLAQNMKADILIIADVISIGENSAKVNVYNLDKVIHEAYFTINYRIFYCGDKGMVYGKSVTGIFKYDSDKIISNAEEKALEDAAKKVTDDFKGRSEMLAKLAPVKLNYLTIKINSNVDAEVYFNGLLAGKTKDLVKLPEGIGFLEIKREHYKSWANNINVIQDLSLNVNLVRSEDGYKAEERENKIDIEKNTAEALIAILNAEAKSNLLISEGKGEMYKNSKSNINENNFNIDGDIKYDETKIGPPDFDFITIDKYFNRKF